MFAFHFSEVRRTPSLWNSYLQCLLLLGYEIPSRPGKLCMFAAYFGWFPFFVITLGEANFS